MTRQDSQSILSHKKSEPTICCNLSSVLDLIMEKRIEMRYLVLSLCFVAGCAPSTVQGLREKHHGKVIFEVQENYQPVYRKIVTNARDRFQAGLITAQMIVQGTIVLPALQDIMDKIFYEKFIDNSIIVCGRLY